MNDKTLAEHKQRQEGKQVELDQPDDQREDCAATAWHAGKIRTCVKPHGHDGKHKTGRFEWRPRSGDRRGA